MVLYDGMVEGDFCSVVGEMEIVNGGKFYWYSFVEGEIERYVSMLSFELQLDWFCDFQCGLECVWVLNSFEGEEVIEDLRYDLGE